MAKAARHRDFRGELIFLGTGTSVGVPAIGCGCPVCTSPLPENQRTRCAIAVGLPEGNLLIDTPPDLRFQMLREQIGLIHSVLFTHEHADHIFGLDDLRILQFYLDDPLKLYLEPKVEEVIRRAYAYAFDTRPVTHTGAIPQFELRSISTQPFSVLGAEVIPIRLNHGPRFDVLGFRIGNIAYCTDTNGIPEESWSRLQGLDLLILDALRFKPHATHFSLDEAVEIAQRIGARRTLLTHVSHELEYVETNRRLPPGIDLAHDGLRIPLT